MKIENSMSKIFLNTSKDLLFCFTRFCYLENTYFVNILPFFTNHILIPKLLRYYNIKVWNIILKGTLFERVFNY